MLAGGRLSAQFPTCRLRIDFLQPRMLLTSFIYWGPPGSCQRLVWRDDGQKT